MWWNSRLPGVYSVMDMGYADYGVAGVTQNAIKAGHDHTYRWVAPHAGTFWYHSHQVSHEQVAQGLLGAIVIHPRTVPAGSVETVALSHLYEGEETVNGRTG